MLRCIPANLSHSSWPGSVNNAASASVVPGARLGSAVVAALAGLSFSIRPGSTLRAASAGLLLGVRPSSHCCAALAGIARAHLHPNPLGSSGQCHPELHGSRI